MISTRCLGVDVTGTTHWLNVTRYDKLVGTQGSLAASFALQLQNVFPVCVMRCVCFLIFSSWFTHILGFLVCNPKICAWKRFFFWVRQIWKTQETNPGSICWFQLMCQLQAVRVTAVLLSGCHWPLENAMWKTSHWMCISPIKQPTWLLASSWWG